MRRIIRNSGMSSDEIRQIMHLLSGQECTCGESFEKTSIRLTDPPNRRKFREEKFELEEHRIYSRGVRYTCDCGVDWEGLIDRLDNAFRYTLQNSDGGQRSGSSNQSFIELRMLEGYRLFNELSEIIISDLILEYHLDSVEEIMDSVIQLHMSPRQQTSIIAHLKAYFAEAYSLERTFETVIESDFPEKERAWKLYDRFQSHSRVVMGLRIYTQKERNYVPDFTWNMEGELQLFFDPDDVRVMESYVDENPPDGYKGEDGSEKYYGHISAERIDLLDELRNHHEQVKWFIKHLIRECFGPDANGHDDIVEWLKQETEYQQRLYSLLSENPES